MTHRLPVPDAVTRILLERHARWDGVNTLHPAGEDIQLRTRIVEFSVVMELHRRVGGLPLMIEIATKRSGSRFNPNICDLFLQSPEVFEAGLGVGLDWETYQGAEPGDPILVNQKDMRDIAEAFADLIDTKSSRFLGHSRNVAALAYRCAVSTGLSEDACQSTFNAGLLHDIGKSAIPGGVAIQTTVLMDPAEIDAAAQKPPTYQAPGTLQL